MQGDPEPEQPDEPRQVGYKLFSTGKDAADYYRDLVKKLTKNQDLNQVWYLLQCCPSPSPTSTQDQGNYLCTCHR